MPSPGILRHLKPGRPQPHTIEQCDYELERLADLARSRRPTVRAQALARINCWLDERLRAMHGEMLHPEDRARHPEWGPLG